MEKFCTFLRQESHIPPDAIVRSQWQSKTKNMYYLIYRWLIVIYYVVTETVSASITHSWYEYGLKLIYLRTWAILLNLATAIYGAVLVTMWNIHPRFIVRGTKDVLPISFKCYWAMHNAATTLSCIISIVFWVILYDESMPIDTNIVLIHGVNMLILLLDMLIVEHPFRLYHVCQPLCLGLLYLVFSIIFYAAGGTDIDGHPYIYNVLDWSKPKDASILSATTLCLAVLVHIVLYAVQKLRVFVFRKLATAQDDE